MKNYQGYKTLSDYQKNSAKIITTNSGLPDIYNRVVILSTLNTGSDPYKNNIIEISCMEMMGGKLTGREFDAYLRPRYSINEVTKQNTNLNNNFYEDFFKNVYSSDKDVLLQFKNFVNNSKIITFNSKKEFIFINNELKYNGIPTYQKIRFYSLIDIFKYIFPSSNTEILSLYQVSKFLEIRLPQEKKLHTSKSDCFIVAKIVSKLYDIINIPQKSIELKNGIIPIDKTEQINLNNININNKKISLSSEKSSNSKTPEKNSENEFDYPDSLIEIIEKENRESDENVNENIVNNNTNIFLKKENKKNSEINKDIKFLNNKRKTCKIEENLNIKFNPNELNFEK